MTRPRPTRTKPKKKPKAARPEQEGSELLPCPFCGEQPQRNEYLEVVWCDARDCALEGVHIYTHSWNTRKGERSR